MKKGRYTEQEDLFIIAFFDGVGPMIGPHDLGRSEASVKKRAKFLKESGAWISAKTSQHHMKEFRVRAGHLKQQFFDDWSERLDEIVGKVAHEKGASKVVVLQSAIDFLGGKKDPAA